MRLEDPLDPSHLAEVMAPLQEEIDALKAIVRTIDPTAFVIVSDVREVLGEGFKSFES